MTNGTNEKPNVQVYNAEGLLTYSMLLQNYLHSPNPTRIVDYNFQILSQNPAMDKMTQIPPSEAKGKKCYQLMRAQGLCNTENCPLSLIMSGHQQVALHCERELWNGKTFPSKVLVVPFHNEEGELVGMIEITTDETETVAITSALEEKHRVLQETHKLLKAQTDIVHVLNQEIRPEALAQKALQLLIKHTPAVLGIIYGFDENSSLLHPLASHAIDTDPQAFPIGHGLPGQVFKDNEVRFIEEVPEDYFRFSSGLGEKRPTHLACIPIVGARKVLGVLELGAFQSLESLGPFLQNTAVELGIAMHNALILKKAEALAQELQEKNEKLEAQNEELQAQSEELIAQSEEIQAQAEELAAQRDALEQKTLEAEEASRLKSTFLSNMSHELRTPLNAILGLTRLMKDGAAGPLNSKQDQYLSIVLRNGNNLLDLINDILDLSRIETGREVVRFDKIHLKGFLESLTTSIRPLAERKGLDFILQLDSGLGTIVSDERKLRQILTNLLGNAVKFTEKGFVKLSVDLQPGKEHDYVHFSVEDSGIGIPPGYEEIIFEPFRQVNESATRKYGGTGLGLNICKKLVGLLGGEIGVKSRSGQGSTFTVVLPVDRRSKNRPSDEEWEERLRSSLLPKLKKEAPPESAFAEGIPEAEAGEHHILIIDDDMISIRELGLHLRDAGFKLSFAFDGQAGLRLLQKNRPDLVLLDIKMPIMDGFQVLEHMKTDSDLCDIPVLVLTALDLDQEAEKRLTGNVKGILRKGNLLREDLLREIRSILGDRAKAGLDEDRAGKHPEEKSSGRSPRPRGVPRPGGRKILVAEDNPDNMFLLEEVLGPEGYQIIKARDGWEAVDLAKEHRPDLILMDIQMPQVGGLEATQAIRNTPEIQDIPIIALTAKAMKGDRDRIISAGLDDYISKPVEPMTLKEVLRKWLY